MTYYTDKNAFKESKGLKRLRIFIAVMYFIQVLLNTFPYFRGLNSKGVLEEFTTFGWIVTPGNFQTVEGVKLTLFCAVFLLFPLVAFFFFCLDTKSNKKNIVSAVCCIVCASLITFFIGPSLLAGGSLIALLLYVFIMFLTVICMLKTAGEKQEFAKNLIKE